MIAINKLITISNEQCNLLMSLFQDVKLENDDYFICESKNSDSIMFLTTGILKTHSLNKNGSEFICCFHKSSQFVPYSKQTNKLISPEKIQSIGSTQLYIVSKKKLEQQAKGNNFILEFILKVFQNYAAEMEKRINSLMNSSANSRYLFFINNYPDLFLKIKLQQLASYIGISPQHLSRLIKKNQFILSH